MQQLAEKLRVKVGKCPPGSLQLGKAQADLSAAYRENYRKYRDRVCAHCLSTHRQTMKYKLYDGASLCFPCRRLEPYAYITKTQARKFFKFGKLAVERAGHQLHFANISYGSTPGTIYRFGDMVQLAELAVGSVAAAEQADKARAALGIGQMKGEQLKDV